MGRHRGVPRPPLGVLAGIIAVAMLTALVTFWTGRGAPWAIVAGFVALAAGEAVVWPRKGRL